VTLRTVPLAVGLGATALGLGLAVVGAPLLPGGAVSTLPLLAVAVFAVAVAVLALLVRSLDGERGPRLPDTDSQFVSVPGDAVDDALAAGEGREAIRRRTEAVAVAALEREGLSPSEASDALGAGTWTDTAGARELFDGTPITLRDRLSGWLSGTRPFRRRVALTTAELLRRTER